MPPGISRENVKKRKTSTSEGSDELGSGQEEQQQPDLNIAASRQRRTAAMKSHKVWDVLKPGAKVHTDGDGELSETSPPIAPKVGRPSLKRKTPSSSFTSPTEESTKMEDELGIEKEQMDEKTEDQQLNQKGIQRIVVNRKMAATSLSTTNLLPQPQPAKDRGQLQLIEKEVEKHQQFEDEPMTNVDEPSDDEDEDKMSTQNDRVLLDDPNDEDYPEFPTRAGRRGRGEHQQRGRGRGSRGGQVTTGQSLRGTTSTRGRPRGSRMPMGGGVMGGRFALGSGRGSRMQMGYYPSARAGFGPSGTSPIYSIQPSGGIIGDLPLRPPAVRIVRPRPAGEIAAQQPSASTGFRTLSIRAPPNYNEESFKINRELENYRDSIVHGTSVQQFNDIIDQLLNELSRAADDRDKLIASHREYIDHLQLTHSAAQEIKDKRIKQLEQCLEQMQQKLMLSFKYEQLHLVKNNLESSSQEKGVDGEHGEQKQLVGHPHQQQLGPDAGDSSGEVSTVVGGHSSSLSSALSQMENTRPAGTVIRHIYPIGQLPSQNQQRVRVTMGSAMEGTEGTVNAQLQQHQQQQQFGINSPYGEDYDDELEDDEEDFDYDEGDSADIDDDLGAQVTI